jgi:hypothetical protein
MKIRVVCLVAKRPSCCTRSSPYRCRCCVHLPAFPTGVAGQAGLASVDVLAPQQGSAHRRSSLSWSLEASSSIFNFVVHQSCYREKRDDEATRS